jgi:hypothetical protein
MTKKDKPRPMWLAPKPGTLGERLAREIIDSPGQAQKKAEDEAAELDALLASRDVQEEVKRQTPKGLDWVAPLFRQRAARLKAGHEEAQAIMAILDQSALGELRRHLEAHPPSTECVIWLLHENRRLSASRAARSAAQQKNAAPREFVATEWKNRADPGQSKASFARMVAPMIQKRFGARVTPERIARYWLKDE